MVLNGIILNFPVFRKERDPVNENHLTLWVCRIGAQFLWV